MIWRWSTCRLSRESLATITSARFDLASSITGTSNSNFEAVARSALLGFLRAAPSGVTGLVPFSRSPLKGEKRPDIAVGMHESNLPTNQQNRTSNHAHTPARGVGMGTVSQEFEG